MFDVDFQLRVYELGGPQVGFFETTIENLNPNGVPGGKPPSTGGALGPIGRRLSVPVTFQTNKILEEGKEYYLAPRTTFYQPVNWGKITNFTSITTYDWGLSRGWAGGIRGYNYKERFNQYGCHGITCDLDLKMNLDFEPAPNLAPTNISLEITTSSVKENVTPAQDVLIADILVEDDGLGENTVSLETTRPDAFHSRFVYLSTSWFIL